MAMNEQNAECFYLFGPLGMCIYFIIKLYIHLYSPSNGSMKKKNIHTYKK